MSSRSRRGREVLAKILAGLTVVASREVEPGEPALWVTVSVSVVGSRFRVIEDFYYLSGVTGESLREEQSWFDTADLAQEHLRRSHGLSFADFHE